MENTLEIIKSRRSTRKYKAEVVSEEQLNQIIEAGRGLMKIPSFWSM